jgi:hypothetical protein
MVLSSFSNAQFEITALESQSEIKIGDSFPLPTKYYFEISDTANGHLLLEMNNMVQSEIF